MHLGTSELLGQGGTKTVYSHPSDPHMCIKFPRTERKKRAEDDLLREIKYLKKHQDHLSFLSKYYGTVETNLGTGYLYQRALNEDGSPAPEMPDFLHTNPDRVVLHKKVAQLYNQLLTAHAVASDLRPPNFFSLLHNDGDYSLFLADGFGNSDFIKICDHSKFFLKRKLARKFMKLAKRFSIPNDFIQ